jgi:hypothetical protein
MSDNMILNLAHHRVHAYAEQSDVLMRQHAEAMECRDCEVFLQRGIDANKWLRCAEESMREADKEGIFTFSQEIQDTLDALYLAWINPCEFAERWIQSLAERGYQPENRDDFRRACEETKDLLERRDWQKKAANARVLSTSKEPW